MPKLTLTATLTRDYNDGGVFTISASGEFDVDGQKSRQQYYDSLRRVCVEEHERYINEEIPRLPDVPTEPETGPFIVGEGGQKGTLIKITEGDKVIFRLKIGKYTGYGIPVYPEEYDVFGLPESMATETEKAVIGPFLIGRKSNGKVHKVLAKHE